MTRGCTPPREDEGLGNVYGNDRRAGDHGIGTPREDPFWRQTFRGRTYRDIVLAVVAGIGRLRDEFPQMSGFDPVAAKRAIAGAAEKRVAYARDMALARFDPDAPPGTHARRLLVHKPTSPEGILITIDFHTPAEGRSRRSTSERLLAPQYIGEMFLEVDVAAADERLVLRVWAVLRAEGLELRHV